MNSLYRAPRVNTYTFSSASSSHARDPSKLCSRMFSVAESRCAVPIRITWFSDAYAQSYHALVGDHVSA